MEAKVDVRKLQVLSDRINQATDALNQVRASVHGLGHTTAATPWGYGYGAGQFGSQFGGQFGNQFSTPWNVGSQSQMSGLGYGTYGQSQMNPWQMGFVPGLQHTTGIGQSQYGYGMPQFSGYSSYPYNWGMQSQLTPWSFGQTGLQHSMSGVGSQTPFYGSQSNIPFGISSQMSPYGMFGQQGLQGVQGLQGLQGLQHTSAMQQNPYLSQMSQFQGIPGVMGITPEIVEQRVLEARASDPARLAQTFPNVFSQLSPVGIW